MYNEKQKRAFIESHTNSDKTTAKIIQIFSWFERYEEDWNMDLSQQEADELQPVVNELTGVRSKSTELILIILKEYVKWCGRNGYDEERLTDKLNQIEAELCDCEHACEFFKCDASHGYKPFVLIKRRNKDKNKYRKVGILLKNKIRIYLIIVLKISIICSIILIISLFNDLKSGDFLATINLAYSGITMFSLNEYCH